MNRSGSTNSVLMTPASSSLPWSTTGSGWGSRSRRGRNQFPCLYEWQNFQAGQYALGIEPSTNHVLGNNAARERGEMIWLQHGDERRYDSVFRVLDGAADIAASEARIRAISGQPEDEYPAVSGDHIKIGGR